MAKGEKTSNERSNGAGRSQRRIPAWQMTLLVCSVALMLVGGGLWIYASVTAPDAPLAASAPSGVDPGSSLAPGLVPRDASAPDGTEGAESAADDRLIDDVSPTIFRLGFSFFAGFAMGFALRTFVKLSLLAIGVLLLALFGLDYAGLITVNVEAMSGLFDRAGPWLATQFESLRAFLTGYLPSAASGAAGLVVGLKRK